MQDEETGRVTVAVRGMHCASCVAKVEGALRGVPGVRDATVNLATERATVLFDSTAPGMPALRRAGGAARHQNPGPPPAAPPPPAERARAAQEAAGGGAPPPPGVVGAPRS